MLNILFITFYIKKEKVEFISSVLKKQAKLQVIYDYSDFEKVKNIEFDFILTAYYWKINWADHFEKKKFNKEIPSYIKYKHLVFQDSNPLSSYAIDTKFKHNYFVYRFSIGSIEIPKQINIISKDVLRKKKKYNFQIKPYKKPNDNLCILILLQNYFNHFLNMTIEEYQQFNQDIINEIRKYSKNKIILRYKKLVRDDDHRKYKLKLKDPINNLVISGNNTLEEDIQNSYVAIAHSTNAVVKVCLEGVHIISLSPYCLCHEFADKEISYINNPTDYDRELLYQKLLSCTWSYDDFESGLFVNYLELHSNK